MAERCEKDSLHVLSASSNMPTFALFCRVEEVRYEVSFDMLRKRIGSLKNTAIGLIMHGSGNVEHTLKGGHNRRSHLYEAKGGVFD